MNLDWRVFAVASAFFAALTAIFGKVGVSEMNSDLATFLRTIVILLVTALLIWARHEWQRPDALSPKGVLFLVLSGVATGLSWLCYYPRAANGSRFPRGSHRQAQRGLGGVVRGAVPRRTAHLEDGIGKRSDHRRRSPHGALIRLGEAVHRRQAVHAFPPTSMSRAISNPHPEPRALTASLHISRTHCASSVASAQRSDSSCPRASVIA